MTFTYGGDPKNNILDAIRLEIGDTDSEEPLLQDAEIEYIKEQEGDTLSTAARCCEVIARKLSKYADRAIGSLRVSLSQRASNFDKQAERLRRKALVGGKPYSGGRVVSDRKLDESNRELVQPAFRRGMMDNH